MDDNSYHNLDDGEESGAEFSQVPHPDDRIWRHPSEIAALNAKMASAETKQVPKVQNPFHIARTSHKTRRLMTRRRALGAVLVSAVALMALLVSTGQSQVVTSHRHPAPPASAAPTADPAATAPAPAAAPPASAAPAGSGSASGQEIFTKIPLIQVARAEGVQEGGGIFINSAGTIATTESLSRNADYIIVWSQGQRFQASLLATHEHTGVAFLQIDSLNCPRFDFAKPFTPLDRSSTQSRDGISNIGFSTGRNKPSSFVFDPVTKQSGVIRDVHTGSETHSGEVFASGTVLTDASGSFLAFIDSKRMIPADDVLVAFQELFPGHD